MKRVIQSSGGALRSSEHAPIVLSARHKIQRQARMFFADQRAKLLEVVEPLIRHQLDHRREATADEQSAARNAALAMIPATLAADILDPSSDRIAAYDARITRLLNDSAEQVTAEAEVVEAGLSDDLISGYLRQRGLSKLAVELNQTTLKRLRDALADEWLANGSFDDFVNAVKAEYSDFETTRAVMIAQTEVNDAYNFGRREKALELGYTEKEWDIHDEACPICIANSLEGWIPIAAVFLSGHQRPTAHPNCDCSLNFRLAV